MLSYHHSFEYSIELFFGIGTPNQHIYCSQQNIHTTSHSNWKLTHLRNSNDWIRSANSYPLIFGSAALPTLYLPAYACIRQICLNKWLMHNHYSPEQHIPPIDYESVILSKHSHHVANIQGTQRMQKNEL